MKRWTVYATLLSFCMNIDLLHEDTLDSAQFIYFGHNIGVTGFLPPLYLFFLWIQPTSSFLSKGRIIALVERWTPEAIKNWNSSRLYTKHPKVILACTFLLLETLNACLSTYMPGQIYLYTGAIPFVLYGADKLTYTLAKHRSRSVIWFVFFGVLAGSITLSIYTLVNVIGPVVLFSSLYILAVSWLKSRYERRHRGAEA
jgi:hypothetical protein